MFKKVCLKRLALWLVVFACGGVGAAGCSSPRQDEVGSAHVAVLSVAGWEDYAQAVQPTFTLTADQALAAAIPNTRTVDERILDAFAARLKAALPGTSFTETLKTTSSSTADPAFERERTETSSSGDVSGLQFGASPAGERTAAGLPSGGFTKSDVGTNALLKYWAAAALYQEVQLINRYLKDAAVDAGYTPYVVRVQVSLMPRLRGAPYDAYATMSFFWGDFPGGVIRDDKRRLTMSVTEPRPALYGAARVGDASDDPAATTTRADGGGAVERGGAPQFASDERVKILPLLVTDDLEATIQSRSVNEVRELALALSAIVQGVGIGTDLQQVDEKLRTILARDFNSTFTVARLSDNTLRCRFGALYQAQDTFAMVPQTHNVSLLVLVPDDLARRADLDRKLRLVSKTELVEVGEIEPLPDRTRDDVYAAVRGALKSNDVRHVPGDLRDPRLRRVVGAVAANDFVAFRHAVNRIHLTGSKTTADDVENAIDNLNRGVDVENNRRVAARGASFVEAIFADVVAIRTGSQYATASFSIPEKRVPGLETADAAKQTPVLLDDGKTTAATIRGGTGLRAGQLAATLTVGDRVFPATGFRVLENGKEVTAVFPSMAAFGLAAAAKTAQLNLSVVGRDARVLLPARECVYVSKPDATKPGFELASGSRAIVAVGDKGKVQVVFSPADASKPPPMRFEVSGADVDVNSMVAAGEEQGLVVKPDGGGWTVSKGGTLLIPLSNLNPFSQVTISASNTDNKAKTPDIVLPVVVQQPSQKP